MDNPYQLYPITYAMYFIFPLLSLYITKFDHERLRRKDEANKHPIDDFAYFPPKWAYPVVWTILYMFMSISIFSVYLLAYHMPEWLFFTIHITYFANFFLNKFWVWVFFDFKWYTPATGFTLCLFILSTLYVVQCVFISSAWRFFAIGFALPLVIWELFVLIVVAIVASYEDSAVEKARAQLKATESIDTKTTTMIERLTDIARSVQSSISPAPATMINPPSSKLPARFL